MGVAVRFVGFGNTLGGRVGGDEFATTNEFARTRGGRFGGLRGGRGGRCGITGGDAPDDLIPVDSRCPNGLVYVSSEGSDRDELIVSIAAVDKRDIGCIGGAGSGSSGVAATMNGEGAEVTDADRLNGLPFLG